MYISNASDYDIFKTRSESETKVYIVIHLPRTSNFRISYENFKMPSQTPDFFTAITEKLDKFMEKLTKENDEFKSSLLEKIEEMLNRYQQIASKDTSNCDNTPNMDCLSAPSPDQTIYEDDDDVIGAEKYPVITITDSDQNYTEQSCLATIVRAETPVLVEASPESNDSENGENVEHGTELLNLSGNLVATLELCHSPQESLPTEILVTEDECVLDLALCPTALPDDKDNGSYQFLLL